MVATSAPSQAHHHNPTNPRVKRAASSETTNGAAIKGKRSKKEPEEPKEKYDEVRHRPPPYPGQQFRVLSWNVAGLWAMLNKVYFVYEVLARAFSDLSVHFVVTGW